MYPINLDIENKKCVVVGGGKVAFRKIRGLLEAGAKVEVISPEFCNEIEELFIRKVHSEIKSDEFNLILEITVVRFIKKS